MRFTKKELERKAHTHRYMKRLSDYKEELSKDEKEHLSIIYNVNDNEEYAQYMKQFDNCKCQDCT